MKNEVVLAWCIAVCMVMGRSAPGQQATCSFNEANRTLICHCVPTAQESLHLRNLLRSFTDVCIRGEGDELCCRNASHGWVVADHVILKYSRDIIPNPVYAEIGFGNSDWKCPRQLTEVDQVSSPPEAMTLEPEPDLRNGSDGGDAQNRFKNLAGVIAGSVIGAFVLVAGVLILCFHLKNRTTGLCWNGTCSRGSTICCYSAARGLDTRDTCVIEGVGTSAVPGDQRSA